jgi:hypothetical protein
VKIISDSILEIDVRYQAHRSLPILFFHVRKDSFHIIQPRGISRQEFKGDCTSFQFFLQFIGCMGGPTVECNIQSVMFMLVFKKMRKSATSSCVFRS